MQRSYRSVCLAWSSLLCGGISCSSDPAGPVAHVQVTVQATRDLLPRVVVSVKQGERRLADDKEEPRDEGNKKKKDMGLDLKEEVAPDALLDITAQDADDVACAAGSGKIQVRAAEARDGVTLPMEEMIDPGQCRLRVRIIDGTVQVPSQGKSCAGDCTLQVPKGSIERLEPVDDPARGWFFSHWGGRCGGQRHCSVHVDQGLELTAYIVPDCDGMLCMKGAGTGPWLAGLMDKDRTWVVGGGGRAAIVEQKSGLAPMIAAEEQISLHAIAGPGQSPWAVGSRGAVLGWDKDRMAWRKDQTAMALVPGAEQITWHGAWATADGKHVWVVGTAGRVLHLRDGVWRSRPLDEERTLFAVSGAEAPVRVWAVGAGGGIYRWDQDRGFVREKAAEDDLYAVAVAQDGTVWAAGKKLLCWPVGASPIEANSTVDEIRGLLAISNSEALAVGSKEVSSEKPGRLLQIKLENGALAFKGKELRARPRALWGDSQGLWIAGDRGALWQGPAGPW